MEMTPPPPALARADGIRGAPQRVSAGSPTRRAMGARKGTFSRPGGAVSAPSTPTGGGNSSMNAMRARHPSSRFTSGARTPKGSQAARVAPPRRMSTRLQLTLRERLHSRRDNNTEQTPSELADDNGDGDDDDGDDGDEDQEDGDQDESSSDSSDDEAVRGGSRTGNTSSPENGRQVMESPQEAAARRASGRARSKASMSVRQRERRLQRRRRRWLHAALRAIVATYYLFSLPLRFGLYFDPFFSLPYAKQWTRALTVFITLDAVVDVTSVMLWVWKRHLERRRERRRQRLQREVHVDGAEAVDESEDSQVSSRLVRWSDMIDATAFFPVEIVLLATGQYNALHIARLTKLLALRWLPSALGHFIMTTRSRPIAAPSIMGRVLGRFLATLMVIGVVWVHWSALIYILIAHVECGLNLTRTMDCVSWAVDDQLRGVEAGGGGGSRFRIYSRAVYWASRTVITLGFSDVVANASRSTETFLMILGEFAGAFWCACVIAGFAYWFTLQHRRGSKYSHEMFVHRVEHLLGRPHFGHSNADTALGSVVPYFLRRQIVEYLHHEWKKSRVFRESEFRSIVRQEQLRQGLTCELKTTKLLRLPCFSRQSLGFLNALAAEMKLVSLAPLDWIIEYPGTQSVFFVVVSGAAAVVSPEDNGQKVYTCNPGDCFGAITLYDASVLKEKAFAEDYAEILVLDSAGLERVLETYYHDRQSTAGQQRDEMHRAALEDYSTFSERCRRRRERRSVLEQREPTTANLNLPHWDKIQTDMEHAQRVWTHPDSRFRVNWEGLRCLALLYLTFEVAYNVVFYYGGTSSSSFGGEGDWTFRTTFAISVLVELFFYADLYMRCRSFHPRKDMKTRTFYLDAVANLPLALFVDVYDGCTVGPLPVGWKWLSLFRLIRLLRVRRLKKRIIATLPRANGVAQFIIYSAISILVYCHFVACLWFLAGHYSLPASQFASSAALPTKPDCLRMAQEHGNCTWTVMDGMEWIYGSGDHRFVYLRSMYFSISTFTTVAYGDILPYSTLETWIAAIATFVGGVLCYVMFGAMGAALARLARRRRENRYENHLRARVLEMHGVTRRLRSEINRFQTFRANTLAEHELELEVLKFVTCGLRGELSKCIHGTEARRLAFLQSAKPEFRDAVAAQMTRRFYFSGDTIFNAGEIAQEVMVIRRGRVQLMDGDSHAVITVLADGATIGERSFVTQVDPILVDYVAETLMEVSVLPREAIVELWKHYPSEMRRMVSDEADEHGVLAPKSVPVASRSTNGPSNALFRAPLHQDSRCNSERAEFETRVKLQRAINGNTFRSRWEVVVGTVVVYNTFSIIARVAFIPSPSTAAITALTCIDYLFDVVLLIDIYLKCAHFVPPGDLLSVSTRIYEPKHIRSYYHHEGWMVFDLFASIPLYYVGKNYALMTYFRLPRILRALQLVEIGERVHSGLLQRWTASTSSAGVAYSLVGLSKVLVVLLLCCHIGGSVFYAASSHESDSSGRAPWVRGDVVMGQHAGDLGVAYLRSFYWAISTVTVVNYGDIVATTVRETAWACVICLCGTFFMSKVIGDLVDLLQSLDQCATEHRERVEQFEYVAQRRELPDELTERGQVFLNYEYEVTHGLPPPEELFSSLPSQLQAQVYDEMYGSILRRVPLFESLTDSQIRELAAAPWRTELFLPGDVIVYENSLADSLYVMKHGRGEILRFGSQLTISQIESGRLFGEAMFFISDEDQKGDGAGPRRMASVRALSFCEVLRLDREAWLRFMAMRASNRMAGRRVLEIAQGEQLKSRTLLQKLESNLDRDRYGSSDEDSRSRSSISSDEKRDGFTLQSPQGCDNFYATAPRDLHTSSAPSSGTPTAAAAQVRRIGSTPASLFSDIVRSLSFNRRNPRPSDAYVAVATPTTARRLGSPTQESPPRHASSGRNALRRFESSPMTPEQCLGGYEEGGSRELDEPQSAPVLRFVDSSVFCYRWDAIKFFAILYYVAALPLRVSFYDDIERAAQKRTGNGDRVMTIWIICEYVIVDGFLWLDILMRLFVFIPTVRGEPLTSHSARRRWYIRHGSFLIDILGSFPLEILALLPIDAFRDGTERGAIVAAGFRLTTLLRCFQLEPLWWRLERQLFWFQKDTLTILKIAFIGVLSSHWIACLWYFVGTSSVDSNPLSWLTAPGMLALDPTGTGSPLNNTALDDVSMLDKYLRSYHYAIGSISTTTFGDIVSRNVPETFVQLVVTFLCLVFYGYVTSGVRQILTRKFSRTIALEHDDAKIRGFARHYGLSRSLTSLIRSHLRERWRQESDVDQRAVADLVHGPLRRAIAAYLRSSLFETVAPRRLAFDSLPEAVVTTILAELREEAYVQGEVIYEQYAVGRVMYFVESGCVELTTQRRRDDRASPPVTTCRKQQGEFFGESCVVDRAACGSERRATAVAQTASRLVVLELDAYERVLAQFPTHAAAIRAAWSSQPVSIGSFAV